MSEGGTLCQLKHLINRTNIPEKPKQNVHAAEECFEVVVIGHFIAAALHHFKMNTIQDSPSSTFLDQLDADNDSTSQKELFNSAVIEMVSSYINISSYDDKDYKDNDQVRAYAREVLSLGALLLEFKDSVHEGDGERLLTVWKFLVLIFRSARKTKYSLEGLILLIQAHVILPPRLKQQLLYSRFVNTKGTPGTNISMDLHLEHVNRVVKSAIHSQSSNLSPSAIVRTSRCTGSLFNVAEQFDKISLLHPQSSSHSEAKLDQDISRIVKQLHTVTEVFHYIPTRRHDHFKSIWDSTINSVKTDKDGTIKWMKGHLNKVSRNL